MPESIPASLIVDALKDTFREARAALAAEALRPPSRGPGAARPAGAPGAPRRGEPLGWVLSVPDTHQRTVLGALDKERAIRGVNRAPAGDATPPSACPY